MKIGLLNLEPQYNNMALEKIQEYHRSKGDYVEEYIPLKNVWYDKVYCSSIFSFTDKSNLLIDDHWICGGTGFDLYKKLPNDIENIKIKNNFGFTQRGCNRGCPFCVVKKKEGSAHVVGNIFDIWDGKNDKITLYDNNILMLPEHFHLMCEQLRKTKLQVDWNQGLDIRLLNSDVAEELSSIRHVQYHFAYDNAGMDKYIIEGVKQLIKHGINQSIFFVLIGFNTTIEEDLYRLNMIKKLGQRAYVMFYQQCYDTDKPKNYNKCEKILQGAIKRWANNKCWFAATTFEEFIYRPENRRYIEFYNQIA